MATQLKARLDYDDYCAIPPDGNRYELIDGRVHVAPTPSPHHPRVSKRLQRVLEEYFEAPGRGEVFNAPIDVILTHHDVVQPDLVVVTVECFRLHEAAYASVASFAAADTLTHPDFPGLRLDLAAVWR